MVERCALSGSDLKIKFRTILLTSITISFIFTNPCAPAPPSPFVPNLIIITLITYCTGRPGSSEVPRNPLTRWDVSLIPANGIFLTKKIKIKKIKK